MAWWWWIPIGLLAWFAIALIAGIILGKGIHRANPPDPWE